MFSKYIQFPKFSKHASIVIGRHGSCVKGLISKYGVTIAIPKIGDVKPEDKDKFPFIFVGGEDERKVHEASIHIFQLVITSMTRERLELLNNIPMLEESRKELDVKSAELVVQEDTIKGLKAKHVKLKNVASALICSTEMNCAGEMVQRSTPVERVGAEEPTTPEYSPHSPTFVKRDMSEDDAEGSTHIQWSMLNDADFCPEHHQKK